MHPCEWWEKLSPSVDLQDTRLYFEPAAHDPASAPLLVLIHGATVPAWEFSLLVPKLVDRGWNCLSFDLIGHGESSMALGLYDHGAFLEQVSRVLDALPVKEFYILGHSLGGMLAASWASQQRGRLLGLALAAPLVDFDQGRTARQLLKLPLIGNVLVYAVLLPSLIIRRMWRYRTFDRGQFGWWFAQQALKPGFGQALKNLLTSGVLDDQLHRYEGLAKEVSKIIVLRGSEDEVFALGHKQRLTDVLREALQVEVPNTGHSLHLSEPAFVAKSLDQLLLT